MRSLALTFILAFCLGSCRGEGILADPPCDLDLTVTTGNALLTGQTFPLTVGQTAHVTVSMCGEKAKVRWSSNSPSVSSITTDGSIYALAPGSAPMTGARLATPGVELHIAVVVAP